MHLKPLLVEKDRQIEKILVQSIIKVNVEKLREFIQFGRRVADTPFSTNISQCIYKAARPPSVYPSVMEDSSVCGFDCPPQNLWRGCDANSENSRQTSIQKARNRHGCSFYSCQLVTEPATLRSQRTGKPTGYSAAGCSNPK